MSRIGKKPVPLPSGVKVNINGQEVTVESGPNRLFLSCKPQVQVRLDDQINAIVVEADDTDRQARALHGLTRALINNMVEGVSKGFSKELEIVGVGWSAQVQGTKVKLNVGHADTREVEIITGVQVEVNANRINFSGADKQAVVEFAAQIRRLRPPDPYNGKGIKYTDEHIVRKQGKAFAAGGA